MISMWRKFFYFHFFLCDDPIKKSAIDIDPKIWEEEMGRNIAQAHSYCFFIFFLLETKILINNFIK